VIFKQAQKEKAVPDVLCSQAMGKVIRVELLLARITERGGVTQRIVVCSSAVGSRRPSREHEMYEKVDDPRLDELVLSDLQSLGHSAVIRTQATVHIEIVVVVCITVYTNASIVNTSEIQGVTWQKRHARTV